MVVIKDRFSQRAISFLSRDPIGELGGYNLYIFVQNSPIDLIDMLGLKSVSDCLDNYRDERAKALETFRQTLIKTCGVNSVYSGDTAACLIGCAILTAGRIGPCLAACGTWASAKFSICWEKAREGLRLDRERTFYRRCRCIKQAD